ncbi:MAG: FAD-dependent oxidoreductase [Nitrosomonadales bacterium]|nr:FAD-dependent oxidoreductase [Nitrosomonadales bacterium]
MITLRRINFMLPSPERSPSPQPSPGGVPLLNPLPQAGEETNVKGSFNPCGRGSKRERQLFNSSGRGAGGRGGEFVEHGLRPSSGSGLPAGTRTASEGSDITVTELLTKHGQDANLTQKLWEPLCIAALNTPIHKASAQVLLNVLRDALDRTRADSDMLLPRIDFTSLFPQRAANYVERRGGKVLTSCGVEAITPKDDCIELATAQGCMSFSHVICAAPPTTAAKLLQPIAQLDSVVKQIEALQHQPIYTVYLRYPADVRLPHPMIGLHRRFSQWLFDKGRIAGQHGLLAAVISAEGIHQELSHEQLAQKVIAELREEFGIAEPPEWFRVIAEKRATFACSPNLQRPSQQTALPGLLLAGDYTAGDYPATLESAVLSGLRCVNLILHSGL